MRVGQGRRRRRVPLRVHSHGRAVLLETLQRLLSSFGLRAARDVLVAGCSAGGLAALLSAARIERAVRTSGAPLGRLKAVVFSGIFGTERPPSSALAHASSSSSSPAAPPPPPTGPAVFSRQFASMASLSRIATPACGQADAAQGWRCLIGVAPLEAVPPHIPVFVEQSTADRWQTGCVLGAGSSGYHVANCSAGSDSDGEWDRCLRFMAPLVPGSRPVAASCNAAQLSRLDGFQRSFVDSLRSSVALRRPGYGACVHGCHSHCPGRGERGAGARMALRL